jgi:hypothetical protein
MWTQQGQYELTFRINTLFFVAMTELFNLHRQWSFYFGISAILLFLMANLFIINPLKDYSKFGIF